MAKKHGRKIGRPTKLTSQIQEAICSAIKNTNLPLAHVCRMLAIDVSTVNEWMQRGRDEHPTRKKTKLYAAFALAVEKAEEEAVAIRLLRISKAAMGGEVIGEKVTTVTKPDGSTVETRDVRRSAPNWTADAWILERTRQDQFALKGRMELTGKDGGPVKTESTVEMDLSKATTEELAAALELAKKFAAKTEEA